MFKFSSKSSLLRPPDVARIIRLRSSLNKKNESKKNGTKLYLKWENVVEIILALIDQPVETIVTPKVLKFINYVTTCIKTNYKILQPFARNGTLLKLQKTFRRSHFAKIIPKFLKTYNTVDNTILYYVLYLQRLKKYETIFSIKNLFSPYNLFKQI